jgi:hypothetical protein
MSVVGTSVAGLKWSCHVTAQNCAYRHRCLLRVCRAAGRSTAASLSSWPGAGTARWFALLRTRPESSACVPPCPRDIAAAHRPREPLSLDEAYLDVSENKTGLRTATLVARTIREQIRTELQLTASAGVAPNKFLAKIASDWKKPDGLFVIQPEDVDAFLLPLPVGRVPGVGKVTRRRRP